MWLRPGDKDLHYSDWSHRHLGGDGTPAGNRAWRRRMAGHMRRHANAREAGREPVVPQGRHRYEDFPA